MRGEQIASHIHALCKRGIHAYASMYVCLHRIYRAEDASSTLEEISYVSAVHCGFEATKQF